MIEEWRTIPGFKGQYEASSLGRIRRISGKGASVTRPRYGSVIEDALGYRRVCVMRDGKLYRPGVHVLVAAAFLGECPDGHEVNHIDMDKANNRIENLEYVTHAENLKKAHELKQWTYGRTGQFTAEQIADIRNSSLSQRALAKRYGVTQPLICNIRKGKLYKEVTD